MSILLAIETSVPEASIALSIGGEIVVIEKFESHRQQNKLLFPALEKILATLKAEALTPDQIIVGSGPGSYSGTRISIAAAQGLAIAYRCPVAGLSSFLATETVFIHQKAIAIGDARRDSYFIAEIYSESPHFKPQLMEKETFIQKLEATDPDTKRISFEPKLPVSDFIQESPLSPLLIQAWEKLPLSEQQRLNSIPPQPLYLRPPFITKAKPGHPLLRRK